MMEGIRMQRTKTRSNLIGNLNLRTLDIVLPAGILELNE